MSIGKRVDPANTDRPELQRMLRAVRCGEINVVICTKIDRFTRSLQDFFTLYDALQKSGAQFISLDEAFDTTTATGKAMLKIALVFAELERERTSERTKESMTARAQRGLFNGGRVLGYDLDPENKGVLKVNLEEKALVELIFAKALELGSARKVGYINDQGYRTPATRAGGRGSKEGAALPPPESISS